MNQKNRVIEIYCLLVADLISIVISYVVALTIRFQSIRNLGDSDQNLHLTICLCLMLFCAIFSLLIDWNRGFLIRGYLVEFNTILKYNMIMIVAVGFVLFLMKQAEFFSRLTYGYFFLCNVMVTFLVHIVIKKALQKYLKSEFSKIRVMLITESVMAEQMVQNLMDSMPVNYKITSIAIMDHDEIGHRYNNIEVIANRENLMEVSRQLAVDEVFIRVAHEETETIRELIQGYEIMGVLCHYSIDIIDWNQKDSTIGQFGKYTVVTYSLNQIDYRRRVIKRMIDILGGIVGLIITGILTPFIALAIKINSPGPVFFSQIRIGKNGRRFKFYKFRSMYIDAEERKKELQDQNEVHGLMFKMEDDPRITRVGKFIRKTSIDELPQFYNVLRGDMSLIGTRPPTVDEFEQYSLYYRRRLCMTPGLTGLWQVSGRSDIEDFDQVVQLDLEYIDNWSLSLDIKILFKTILVIFTGKGSR